MLKKVFEPKRSSAPQIIYRAPARLAVQESQAVPDEPQVEIPVTCEFCGARALVTFPLLVVAVAVTKWGHMLLHSDCHDDFWDASAEEMNAIERFLGPEWLEKHRPA